MISILIISVSRYSFDRRVIRKKAKEFLIKAGLDDVEFSLAIIGSRKAKQLNQKYRNLDEPASVLSFALEEPRGIDGILRLGDVMVCYPIARQKAIVEKVMMDEMIWELVEHGLRNLIT